METRWKAIPTPLFPRFRRLRVVTLAAAAIAVLATCDDDTVDVQPQPTTVSAALVGVPSEASATPMMGGALITLDGAVSDITSDSARVITYSDGTLTYVALLVPHDVPRIPFSYTYSGEPAPLPEIVDVVNEWNYVLGDDYVFRIEVTDE